jgi:HD-GYP domain-containing protein (c-di-GMP phosphodiesterase class II)
MIATAEQLDTLIRPGAETSSCRAGFLPISLEGVPKEAFGNIPIYLRLLDKSQPPAGDAQSDQGTFHLYCAPHVPFTDDHRQRLVKHGIRFVYIPIAEHQRFREQTEARLLTAVTDPKIADSVKSRIVYDTSVALMDELLTEPDLNALSPRLENISRSVTMLVLNDPGSFSHLMAASSHDFYTATHMVNVGTWMVPLAYAMGHRDTEELNHICEAGILHDVGKTFVPTEVLNKVGKLTDEDWAWLKRHPALGCEHLAKFPQMHPLISIVTRQHHERIDGTGYPDRLKGDEIHPISKICAVVDSFDAMTAFRPFKKKTMTVVEALTILKSETPHKNDTDVVTAWTELLQKSHPQREELGLASLNTTTTVTVPGAAPKSTAFVAGSGSSSALTERRHCPRFKIKCGGIVHTLVREGDEVREQLGSPVMPMNYSRSGAAFLCQSAVDVGAPIRLRLHGKGALKTVKDGKVIRCRDCKDGWFEVGMAFDAEDAADLPPECRA